MICPQCGSEYVDGVNECADCRVPLADAGPIAAPPNEPASTDPVVVFESNQAELIAIAKSILMSADVQYGVHGEEIQDLFGYGRFPAGANVFIGTVKIVVSADDAPDARALLSGLGSDVPVPAGEPDQGSTLVTDDSSIGSLWARARPVARFAAAALLLLLVLEGVLGVGLNWL